MRFKYRHFISSHFNLKLHGVQGVGGSNPLVPTNLINGLHFAASAAYYFCGHHCGHFLSEPSPLRSLVNQTGVQPWPYIGMRRQLSVIREKLNAACERLYALEAAEHKATT